MTFYAVGDIHGQIGMLEGVHDLIEADRAREGARDAKVVFLGDYTDRGPDSRGVIEWLSSNVAAGAPFVCLAGNHDHMFRDFVDTAFTLDPLTSGYDWLRPNLGGRATLESYGVEQGRLEPRALFAKRARAAVPASHLEFLRGLPTSYVTEDVFFVHAGIHPDRPLDDQDLSDLIWIRQPFLDDPRDHGPLIVHGHTPVPEVFHAGNRVDIDTGAGFGRPLSAVAIEGRDVFLLTTGGRRRVNPPSGY